MRFCSFGIFGGNISQKNPLLFFTPPTLLSAHKNHLFSHYFEKRAYFQVKFGFIILFSAAKTTVLAIYFRAELSFSFSFVKNLKNQPVFHSFLSCFCSFFELFATILPLFVLSRVFQGCSTHFFCARCFLQKKGWILAEISNSLFSFVFYRWFTKLGGNLLCLILVSSFLLLGFLSFF